MRATTFPLLRIARRICRRPLGSLLDKTIQRQGRACGSRQPQTAGGTHAVLRAPVALRPYPSGGTHGRLVGTPFRRPEQVMLLANYVAQGRRAFAALSKKPVAPPPASTPPADVPADEVRAPTRPRLSTDRHTLFRVPAMALGRCFHGHGVVAGFRGASPCGGCERYNHTEVRLGFGGFASMLAISKRPT